MNTLVIHHARHKITAESKKEVMKSNFDSIGLAIASAASSTSVEDIVIKCTLRRVYMEAIKSGSKTYEGRVATDFF